MLRQNFGFLFAPLIFVSSVYSRSVPSYFFRCAGRYPQTQYHHPPDYFCAANHQPQRRSAINRGKFLHELKDTFFSRQFKQKCLFSPTRSTQTCQYWTQYCSTQRPLAWRLRWTGCATCVRCETRCGPACPPRTSSVVRTRSYW